MIEHDLTLNSQLNPLSDEINALGERLKSINLENSIGDSHQKLEKWRDDCHKTIDYFFEQKCRELDQCIAKKMEKQREEIGRMRQKMSELIEEQEATHKDIDSLTSTVRGLEREMNKIEKTSLQVEIKALLIDDSLIQIEDSDANRFDLLSLSPIYKTINYPRENWVPLACNNRYLLLHQEPNLCLVDRDLIIIKQNSWIYGTIYDMCWSSALNRFIVINGSDVFLVDEDNMSIENIQTLQKRKWLSCTTSETSLFLSTKVWGSSIMEFSLLPTIELVKQWQSPDTCTRDEVINGIVYNNGTLAMMIKNPSEKTIHIEMRSSATLDRLWSVRLNIAYSQNIRTRCCLLTHNEWLVVDRNTSRIFHISKDGKVKSSSAYNPPPFCATIFDQEMLAISTARGVNLHRL
jgi:polyhydroxyalkanoate synthesis regulator phasin